MSGRVSAQARDGARRFVFFSALGAEAFAHSVARGLSDHPRWLHCRYLYDAAGSEIFVKINENAREHDVYVVQSLVGPSVSDAIMDVDVGPIVDAVNGPGHRRGPATIGDPAAFTATSRPHRSP